MLKAGVFSEDQLMPLRTSKKIIETGTTMSRRSKLLSRIT
jgi:hypothetical protein